MILLRLTLLTTLASLFSSFTPNGKATNGKQKPPIQTIIIDAGHGGIDPGARGHGYTEARLSLEIALRLKELMQQEFPDLRILMTRESDVLPGNSSTINSALKWRAYYANQSGGDLFISIHLNATGANKRYGKKQIGTKEQKYYVYQGKGSKRKKVAKTRTVPVYETYRLPATVKGTQTYILARDWYNQKVKSVGDRKEIYEGGEEDSLDAEMLEMDPVEARIRAGVYTKYFFQKSLTLASYVEEEFASVGRYSWGVQQRDWDGIWVLQATQMPSILVETGFIDHPEEEVYLSSKEGQLETARCIVNAVKRYKAMLENPGQNTTNGISPTPTTNK